MQKTQITNLFWECLILCSSLLWATQAFSSESRWIPLFSLQSRAPASIRNSPHGSVYSPSYTYSYLPSEVMLPVKAPAEAKPSPFKTKLISTFAPEDVAPALKRSSGLSE